MKNNNNFSGFLSYLVIKSKEGRTQLPSLAELSKEFKISFTALREQLEVAKSLGIVEVRSRTGIKLLPYSFTPAAKLSSYFAVAVDPDNFNYFLELRRNIESSFWIQAVNNLTEADHKHLQDLINQARNKLLQKPPLIPAEEHKRFHLTIFSHIQNPFVTGILETYWDLYEIISINTYIDLVYQITIWDFHQKIYDSIVTGNYSSGQKLLLEHIKYIKTENRPVQTLFFE